MLNWTSSAWYSSIPRDLDSFAIDDDECDTSLKKNELQEEIIIEDSDDINALDSKLNSSSDGFGNTGRMDNSNYANDSNKIGKDMEKDGFDNELSDDNMKLIKLDPEDFGVTLQSRLDYLASTHKIVAKESEKRDAESSLRVNSKLYTYFDENEEVPVEDTLETVKTEESAGTYRPLFLKRPIDYVPPISNAAYDHLNSVKNGVPSGYKSGRVQMKEKEENEKKMKEKKIKSPPKYLKKDFEPQVQPVRRLYVPNEPHNYIKYSPKKLTNNAPSFVGREKVKVEKDPPPAKIIGGKETYTKDLEMFVKKHSGAGASSTQYQTEKRSKYVPQKIKCQPPKGIAEKNPELYLGKKTEILNPELEVVYDPGTVYFPEQDERAKKTRKPTMREVETALQEKIEGGLVTEWDEMLPKKQEAPDSLFSSSTDSDYSGSEAVRNGSLSSDFEFNESMITDDINEATAALKLRNKRTYIDPHETEASKLRNAAIKQKLALKEQIRRQEEEEENERDLRMKFVSARIAPTIRKMAREVELQPKDISDVIRRNKEEERERVEAIDRRIRQVKKTDFIAHREDKKLKKKNKENRKMKQMWSERKELPSHYAKRKEKNEQLRKLWNPDPAALFT